VPKFWLIKNGFEARNGCCTFEDRNTITSTDRKKTLKKAIFQRDKKLTEINKLIQNGKWKKESSLFLSNS
jgi:hypothetical protein